MMSILLSLSVVSTEIDKQYKLLINLLLSIVHSFKPTMYSDIFNQSYHTVKFEVIFASV
jgi:hypothetical protein